MPITMILRKQEFIIERETTVQQALKQIGVSPESHFALRNGELLTEDERLRDGDVVRVIAVISGGQSA